MLQNWDQHCKYDGIVVHLTNRKDLRSIARLQSNNKFSVDKEWAKLLSTGFLLSDDKHFF